MLVETPCFYLQFLCKIFCDLDNLMLIFTHNGVDLALSTDKYTHGRISVYCSATMAAGISCAQSPDRM